MTKNTKIGRILTSVILLILFLLPIAVKSTHFCEEHEHHNTNEKGSFVYDHSTDCSICDFHFSSFVYDFFNFSDFINTTIAYKVISAFTSDFFNLNYNLSFFLRGPPSFLSA